MDLNHRLLEKIFEHPGSSKKELSECFHTSWYRLNRTIRQIERQIEGKTLVVDEVHGIWAVSVNRELCMGMDWVDPSVGFRQCNNGQRFGDARCRIHTDYECPDMTAFKRKLSFMTGCPEPNAFYASQLDLDDLRDMMSTLACMITETRKDELSKLNLLNMLKSAMAIIMWKRSRRRRQFEDWVPPEMAGRNRASSVNPFEFSLKKHFLILEVSADSGRDEVQTAWKRLARRYHPDTGNGDEERMKVINHAKEIIFRIRRWD